MSQSPLFTQKSCHQTDIRVLRSGVLLLCIASLGLAACDHAKTPPTVQAPPEVTLAVSTVVEDKPQTLSGAAEAAVDDGPAIASERILNLTYAPSPQDGAVPAGQGQVLGEQNLLPDMFGQQKKAGNISVSGGLLTDPEKDEYMDSVNGAEVSLKVRTR